MLRISVTIPSYNQGNFLEETILSVLSQEYPNLELFVIDGGSSDESANIIRKYENQLTGWVSEKDSGQSEAINKGFSKSTGDIVAWLCSDDLYTPGALKRVNDIYTTLPSSTGVLHGNSAIFIGERVVNYDKGYGKWPVERQLAGMTFPQPSSFLRHSVLKQVGPLNTSLHFGMDYELFSKMIMISDFRYDDFFYSRYRLHKESKSTTSIVKFIDEWIIVYNSVVEGLDIGELKEKLKQAGLNVQADESIRKFFQGLTTKKQLDYDLMMFYFLLNVIKNDYMSGKFERAKKTGSILKNEYGEYLRSEPSVEKIIMRMKILPPGLLQIARNIKRTLVGE